MVCVAGALPPIGWLNVNDVGVAEAVVEVVITTVTGIVTGLIPAVVGVTVMLPV